LSVSFFFAHINHWYSEIFNQGRCCKNWFDILDSFYLPQNPLPTGRQD
jgi:hypothetical protein